MNSQMNSVIRYHDRACFCFHLDSADNEVNEEQKKEKIAELKNKQESIKEMLALKEEELKKMCLREAVSGLSYFHMLFQVCQLKQSYLKIFFDFSFYLIRS